MSVRVLRSEARHSGRRREATWSKRLSLAAGLAAYAVSPRAAATSETLFGFGPRSAALAQADVACPAPVSAAYANPAWVTTPGTRTQLGYSHGFTALEFDGKRAPVRDIAGTDVAMQLGRTLGASWSIGGGLALHLPDRSLARIGFQPGSEPNFVRFDPASQRMTADVAAGLRWGPLSIGGGASLLVDAQGRVALALAQDGDGAYADSAADVTLPYHLAPMVGMGLDLGTAAVGVRYRGAQSVDLELRTEAVVDVQGNPLNGTTTVWVGGASGYVPATYDLGARLALAERLELMTSLQLARWSEAPSPSADLLMDVSLGLTPGQLQGRFVRPAWRDTLSPRVGVEAKPWGQDAGHALRVGWSYAPSPVPQQRGFATHADASSHAVGFGGGANLGRAWGVALRVDGAAQILMFKERRFDKQSRAMPYPQYTVGGHVLLVSVGLEGAWE